MKKSVTKPMKYYAVSIPMVVSGEQRLYIVKSSLDIELFTRLMTYVLDNNSIVLGTIELHLRSIIDANTSLPSMFVNLSSFIDPERFTDGRINYEPTWCLIRADDAQMLYEDWKADPKYAMGKEILAKRDLVKKEPSKDGTQEKEDDNVYYANKVDHFGWIADKRWPGKIKIEMPKAKSQSNKRKTS